MVKVKKWAENMVSSLGSRNFKKLREFHMGIFQEDFKENCNKNANQVINFSFFFIFLSHQNTNQEAICVKITLQSPYFGFSSN